MKRFVSRLIRKLFPAKPVPAPEIPDHLAKICNQIRDQKLSFLSTNSIYSLVSLVGEVEQSNTQGSIIEAGCALGGSAIAMCAAKNNNRMMNLYDTFEMIPPPTDKDGKDVHDRYKVIKSGKAEGLGGDTYYGYLKDIPERVIQSFLDFGYPVKDNSVHLHKGLVQDTLSVQGPVAIAHIDVDWYDPVFTCLERVVPNLSVGGAIVLDDYFAWSGCRKATDEFFAKRKNEFSFCTKFGHMVVRHRKN